MADEPRFTGERLHANDALFGIDLLRHRAAYREATRRALELDARRILELGSGTGYGLAEVADHLAAEGSHEARCLGLDRVVPVDAPARAGLGFLRGDFEALPLEGGAFDLVLSFQVIEHLPDPTAYVDALADGLAPQGLALVTTPNATFSDGENPFHVREYLADELEALLARRFDEVQMLGVSARGEALAYHTDRLARIRRIVALDPLGLRRRLPQRLVETLFARLAILVRRSLRADSKAPAVSLDDFPIEPAHPQSLDLLAVCRGPRGT